MELWWNDTDGGKTEVQYNSTFQASGYPDQLGPSGKFV